MEFNENSEETKEVQLTQELMSNTMVNEVVRVMLSAQNLEKAIESYFLGISEMTGVQRIGFFKIDGDNFSLRLQEGLNVEGSSFAGLHLSLDFMSGEYPDAIFLNKHIIVDPVEEDDPFAKVGAESYVVMPIVSRITQKCWEVRNCGKTECPCYEGHDPCCWSVDGAALDTGAESEDEKRKACVNCSQFKCEGVLWLDTTGMSEKISAESIGNLSSVNQHLGMVIESFNMYSKIAEANRKLGENNEILTCLNTELKNTHMKIEQELDHAKSIQKGLLPGVLGDLHKDIAARYIPEGKVGGDYYDCFEIEEDLIGMIMADVSGHGIAAALIMSMFKVLLKAYSPILKDPSQVLLKINDTFLKETNNNSFVTVFYATFNKKTREFTYCNAGHNPQLLMEQDDAIRELESNGMFVGMLDEIKIEQSQIVLKDPARLVLFTDGISEAQNPEKVMFEIANISKHVDSRRKNSCAETVEHLMNELNLFRKTEVINDDITLLVIDL